MDVLIVFLCCLAGSSGCHAQGGFTTSTREGCKVSARAYIDPSVWDSSRFDMEVSKLPSGPGQWDFTLDWEGQTTPYYYTSLCNGQSRLPYGKAERTVVKATLWHFDTLDERVTFHNLDLLPLVEDAGTKFGVTPRFLVLKYAVSATCPSGVQITLPAQNV